MTNATRDAGNRRQALRRLATAMCAGVAAPVIAQDKARALREMQIHRVEALGLEIWVENQPPWETQLIQGKSLPVFAAQSPDHYHPPSVMTWVSHARAQSPGELFPAMALGAIRAAAQNYGAPKAVWRALSPVEARHGLLQGFEATFAGKAQGDAVDVRVFIGQSPGRFPVAMQAYTLRGKLDHLDEPIRRSWGKVKYLG
ncbi:hypothetical protein V4F39_17210 [Aquincola sp. MAHUQ-54]|uniref:Uncharacterized protein n=1 Tax=Aquincola agrisoli TaxID=3119538 RepID=A0AAW9QJH8_9BURK